MKSRDQSIAGVMPLLAAGLLFTAAVVGEEQPGSTQGTIASTTIDGYEGMESAWGVLDTNAIRTIPSRNIRTLDGYWDSRFRLPAGVNGEVLCVAQMGRDLFVGGRFTKAGDIEAQGLARWDGLRWWPVGDGMVGAVSALVVHGSSLYAGGSFRTLGSVNATNIARWTRRHGWEPIGRGIAGVNSQVHPQYVSTIAVRGRDVYVGGSFTQVGGIAATNIARWDGSRWSSLAGGIGRDIGIGFSDVFGRVESLAILGRDLYAGGVFDQAGNTWTTNIARWDGRRWHSLDRGVGGGRSLFLSGPTETHSGSVSALAVQGRDLLVGGNFTKAGSANATNLARWNGYRWSSVGGGTQGIGVGAILTRGAEVIVGGYFERAGKVPTGNIARWDGRRWNALQGGVIGTVSALGFYKSKLHVGGHFGVAGGKPTAFIARWNRDQWQALNPTYSTPGGVFPMPPPPWTNTWPVLLANIVTPMPPNPVFVPWTEPTNAVIGEVTAIGVDGDNFYVGGYLWSAGLVPVSGIAHWNGTTWSALGEGIPGGGVRQIAVDGTNVYAAGFFQLPEAGATNLAQWNGRRWAAVDEAVRSAEPRPGPIFLGQPDAIVSAPRKIYVAGQFTLPDDQAFYGISCWDGSQWTPIASLYSTPSVPTSSAIVTHLTIVSNTLYAAGSFTEIGGASATNIAQWDGTNWMAVGVGLRDNLSPYSYSPVRALTCHGTNLYAAGQSLIAETESITTNLQRWDGSTWSAPGIPTTGNAFVLGMAATANRLYVGGVFTNVAGLPARNVAAWNGVSWSTLGLGAGTAGFGNYVHQIAAANGKVYFGGRFGEAGGYPMFNFAVWNESAGAVYYPIPPQFPPFPGVEVPPRPPLPPPPALPMAEAGSP